MSRSVADRGPPSRKLLGVADPALITDTSLSRDAFKSFPREALISVWIDAHGRPPPKGISRRLLEYAAAYHAQAKARGGLAAATKRRLRREVAPQTDSAPSPKDSIRRSLLPAGSRLVREWHGKTHTVDVTASGFLYQDRHYGSLSEVARTITGARWSGPRFFGI